MKLWIARDKDWDLNLFGNYPVDCSGVWKEQGNIPKDAKADGIISLNPDLYPEVTYENSPQQITLKLD